MGYSNPDSGCRRHSNQKQLPGICSSCLRERLSKLSSENNSYKTSNFTFSDSDSESESEDQRGRSHHHRRNGSNVPAAPMRFVLHQGSSNGSNSGNGDVSGSGKMKKSRSVAWASKALRRGNRNGSENGYGYGNGRINEEEEKGKSGKKGLWKKLIHSTSKKTKGVLMHSLTVRERSQSHDYN